MFNWHPPFAQMHGGFSLQSTTSLIFSIVRSIVTKQTRTKKTQRSWWLFFTVTVWLSWLPGISIKNSWEFPSEIECSERERQHSVYSPNSVSSKAYLEFWVISMTSCSWLRIDSFIYLQITSSDCSAGAGKAITSAERKAGNKNYSFRHLFFLPSLHGWMTPILSY